MKARSKAPSTFMFMLRWHPVQFVLGLGLVLASIYGIAMHEPTPAHYGFVSVVDVYGPAIWTITIIGGLGLVASAWWKAYRHRNGL